MALNAFFPPSLPERASRSRHVFVRTVGGPGIVIQYRFLHPPAFSAFTISAASA